MTKDHLSSNLWSKRSASLTYNKKCQHRLEVDNVSASHLRDVSTGATGATEVAPKFSYALTLSPPGWAESAEVASKFSLRLRPCILCLVLLLPQNLFWAYPKFSSKLNVLAIITQNVFGILKIGTIWVYLKHFEYILKIWVHPKKILGQQMD